MSTSTPQLALSEREHWHVTIALELENGGYPEAAAYLRSLCESLAPIWRIEEEAAAKLRSQGLRHIPPGDIFRADRGSNPPSLAPSTPSPSDA